MLLIGLSILWTFLFRWKLFACLRLQYFLLMLHGLPTFWQRYDVLSASFCCFATLLLPPPPDRTKQQFAMLFFWKLLCIQLPLTVGSEGYRCRPDSSSSFSYGKYIFVFRFSLQFCNQIYCFCKSYTINTWKGCTK